MLGVVRDPGLKDTELGQAEPSLGLRVQPGPAMEEQLQSLRERRPGEPSTSVSSLSAWSREQRGKQLKKCKNAFKNTLSFPFSPEAEVLK